MFSTKFCPQGYTIENVREIFHKEGYEYNPSEDDLTMVNDHLNSIETVMIESQRDFQDKISRPLKFRFNKSQFVKIYRILLRSGRIQKRPDIEKWMKMKAARGHSGVNVVTLMTAGSQFGADENGYQTEQIIKRGGCPENCDFCPFAVDENNIPIQPKSYLPDEPANMRATQNFFHPLGQMFDRIHCLDEIGHINENAKLEIIISGGTFNFYPKPYIIWFVRCMYYAANCYFEYRDTEEFSREMGTLEEEQSINESATLRIIGLTVETRPDYLIEEKGDRYDIVRYFRYLGITRVQIGIQHTDDNILRFVSRNCTNDENKIGIKFLKDNGFKVDIHLMLDLPSSTPQKDIDMLTEVLSNPDYEADQWKIYPTEVTPFTKIKDLYEKGIYKPYDDQYLFELIKEFKMKIKPYYRINRIIRDISGHYIIAGYSQQFTNLRQILNEDMRINNWNCKCIRCREIKGNKINEEDVKLSIIKYKGSDANEYFISYETVKYLIGFLRLRLNINYSSLIIPELINSALIRELHIYSNITNVGNNLNHSMQHKGYGKRLIAIAEEIAKKKGFTKMAIIAGTGVRSYYKKLGYELEDSYMCKELE